MALRMNFFFTGRINRARGLLIGSELSVESRNAMNCAEVTPSLYDGA